MSYEEISELEGNVSGQLVPFRANNETNVRFRKYPSLDKVFLHKCWDENGQRTAECRSCGITYTGNRYKRLFDHIGDCNYIESEIKEQFAIEANKHMVDKYRNFTNMKKNLKLTAMIAENKMSFAFVESKTFRSWVGELDSTYRPASRHDISSDLLPSMSLQIEKVFIKQVYVMPDFSLSIEFDHWADIIHREFLGIIATRPDGRRFFFGLSDVSMEGKSARVTVPLIRKVLCKLPSMKINSIISDSAAPCKKARNILSTELDYIHLFEHRCLAHLMNNIGKKMAQHDPVKSVIETASSINGPLNLDPVFLSKLKSLGMQRLKKSCKTRWNSEIEMLESLELTKSVVMDHLEEEKHNRRSKEKIESNLDIMKEQSFWDDLKQSLRIYRPVANCISTIQKADACLSEATRSILECASQLLSLNDSDRFTRVALYAFFSYFNQEKLGEFEYGLMLAAYFLDRRYKMDWLSETADELVLKTLGQIASISCLSGADSSATEEALYSGFLQYKFQRGSLGRPVGLSTKPIDWWQSQPDDLGILKIVAIRLANLKPSSANIERVFSIIRAKQCLNCTNFKEETLTHLTRSNLWISESGEDEDIEKLFDEDDDNEQLTPILRKLEATTTEPLDEINPRECAFTICQDTIQELPEDTQANILEFQIFIDFSKTTRLLNTETSARQEIGDISERLVKRLRADRTPSHTSSQSTLSTQESSSENNEKSILSPNPSDIPSIRKAQMESNFIIESMIEENSLLEAATLTKTKSRKVNQSSQPLAGLSSQSSTSSECPKKTNSLIHRNMTE